jgi:hypothetical protein
MKTTTIAIWTAPLLATGAIALSGCGQRSPTNPTTISYDQVGVCKMWAEPTGFEQKARANELFAIFKIDSIDNSKPSSEFGFDPERMYVNQSTAAQLQKNLSFQIRRFIVADARFAQAMGVSSPQRATVPGNQKLDVNAYVLVPVSMDLPADKPPVGNSYELTFDTTNPIDQWQSASAGINMTKTNPDATFTPVENCKELAYK